MANKAIQRQTKFGNRCIPIARARDSERAVLKNGLVGRHLGSLRIIRRNFSKIQDVPRSFTMLLGYLLAPYVKLHPRFQILLGYHQMEYKLSGITLLHDDAVACRMQDADEAEERPKMLYVD